MLCTVVVEDFELVINEYVHLEHFNFLLFLTPVVVQKSLNAFRDVLQGLDFLLPSDGIVTNTRIRRLFQSTFYHFFFFEVALVILAWPST